jgi:hypothetical protein
MFPAADLPPSSPLLQTATAFDGSRRLKTGPLRDVALAAKRASGRNVAGPVLVFDDASGKVIELDYRGTDRQFVARLASTEPKAPPPSDDGPRGPGRPKLGVVAREVTLLPRHWAWLSSQPGGASVALRKLVEDARRTHAGKDKRRQAREAAYAFMSVVAGDLAGFEEAARALFADDAEKFFETTCKWPRDLAAHAQRLAFADGAAIRS